MDSELLELEKEYDEILVSYRNAVRTASAQIENIKHELTESKTVRNPIKDDYSRIKTFDSALKKCQSKGIEMPTIEQMQDLVGDIAGIRIVCLYLDDIWRVAEMIRKSPGIAVKRVKDYVENPKESGYASLHLKTLVSICSVTKGTEAIPVEIQIRSQLMETWSQVEHRAKYKSENGVTEEISNYLIKLSEQFRETDKLLVEIRKRSGDD